MDEIIIGEKKYISSKQAAKITGYAKDYVGQLCREGRVPARLVGRSWYVLESAIQDHRFGNPKDESTTENTENKEEKWESPRYEATETETIPTINRLQDVETDAPANEDSKGKLQETWKAWFDRFEHVADAGTEDTKNTEMVTEDSNEKEVADGASSAPVDVPIHIRAIHHEQYSPPPAELMPAPVEENTSSDISTDPRQDGVVKKNKSTVIVRAVVVPILVLLTLFVATTAVLGSGYFDKYIISSNRATIISGIGIYNK